jgi:hypothetical protein
MLLADRRLLVVLDNAGSEAQVRPLLPGSPSCGVLVTSRGRLTGLEGARLVDLDILSPEAAVELLARVAGPGRAAAESDAAAAIVGYPPTAGMGATAPAPSTGAARAARSCSVRPKASASRRSVSLRG